VALGAELQDNFLPNADSTSTGSAGAPVPTPPATPLQELAQRCLRNELRRGTARDRSIAPRKRAALKRYSAEKGADRMSSRAAPLPTSAPATPLRFPHELEILIEVWDVDRNQITWQAWLAPESHDGWAMHWRILLTHEACAAWETSWPTWWVVTREVA
jgi:hypothetical protein